MLTQLLTMTTTHKFLPLGVQLLQGRLLGRRVSGRQPGGVGLHFDSVDRPPVESQVDRNLAQVLVAHHFGPEFRHFTLLKRKPLSLSHDQEYMLTWLMIGRSLLCSQSEASILVDTTLDNDNNS